MKQSKSNNNVTNMNASNNNNNTSGSSHDDNVTPYQSQSENSYITRRVNPKQSGIEKKQQKTRLNMLKSQNTEQQEYDEREMSYVSSVSLC